MTIVQSYTRRNGETEMTHTKTCCCDRCEVTFTTKRELKKVVVPAIGESYTLCAKCWVALSKFMLNEKPAPSKVPVENP